MTVDESFSTIIQRMLEGLMLHAQLCQYFNFLGLKGYSQCQKYHYYDESSHYMDLCDYYICHYNKIPNEKKFDNKNIIPSDWHMFTRFDVDPGIRKSSVKTGIEKWVQWEEETKAVFEQSYQNLINLNEIALAEKVKELIVHVDKELANAKKKMLTLKAMEYNISDIMLEQEEKEIKYKKKLKEVKLL